MIILSLLVSMVVSSPATSLETYHVGSNHVAIENGRRLGVWDSVGNTRVYHADGSITCVDSDGKVWSL